MVTQLSIPQASRSSPQHELQTQKNASATNRSPSLPNLVISAKHVLNEARSAVARSEMGSDASSVITSVLQDLYLFEEDFQDNATISPGSKPVNHGTDFIKIIDDWDFAPHSGDSSSQFDSASVTTRTQMTPTQSSYAPSTIGDQPSDVSDTEDSDSDCELENELLQEYVDKGFAICKNGDYEAAEIYMRRAKEASETHPWVNSRRKVNGLEELEYEILQAYLDKGFASYKERKWGIAQLYMQRGVGVSLLLLPDTIRYRGIILEEVKFRVAVCAFHQRQISDPEITFLSQLGSIQPAADENKATTLRRIMSVHLLAEIYLERNKLDEAYKHGRKALSMKRKYLDDMSGAERAMLFLLSAICKAQGDKLQADVYLDKAKASMGPDSSLDLGLEFQLARFDAARQMRQIKIVSELISPLLRRQRHI